MKKMYIKASGLNDVTQLAKRYNEKHNQYMHAEKGGHSSFKEHQSKLHAVLTQRIHDKLSQYCSTSFLDNVKLLFGTQYLKPSILNNPEEYAKYVNFAKLKISMAFGTAYNPVSNVYWSVDIIVSNDTVEFENSKWNISKNTNESDASDINESISCMEALNSIEDSFWVSLYDYAVDMKAKQADSEAHFDETKEALFDEIESIFWQMISSMAKTDMLIYVSNNSIYKYDSYYQVMSLTDKTVRVKKVRYYYNENRIEVSKNAGNVLRDTLWFKVAGLSNPQDIKVISYDSLVH